MIRSIFVLSFLYILAGAYSPKAQFEKSDNAETLKEERDVSPRSVIGGAMGGEVVSDDIQREEAEESSAQKMNCEEALRVCEPEAKERSDGEF